MKNVDSGRGSETMRQVWDFGRVINHKITQHFFFFRKRKPVLKEKQIGFLVKLFACKKVCVNLVKSRGFLHRLWMKFTNDGLFESFREGQRNSNWRRLSRLEKALRMLNMDFTFAKYKELCEAIVESKYTTLTFNQYFSSKNNISEKFIMLRHDVDRNAKKALKMAELENNLGIISTYYFRKKEDVFIPAIIKKIADMGHEIGYHYETLDEAGGDFEKAIRIFEDELKEFRKICNVKTICMHGNPLSKWVNKDLWKKYDFKDFGIIGEPYLSIDYTKVLYLTDTGRGWNSKFSVKDVVGANTPRNEKIKSTDDVIRTSNEGQVDQMCILTHPERWSDNFGAWIKELAWQNMKNVGKMILVRSASSYGKNKNNEKM